MDNNGITCAHRGAHSGSIKTYKVTADDELVAQAALCEGHATLQSFSVWDDVDASSLATSAGRPRAYGTDVSNPMGEADFQELMHQLDQISRLTGKKPEGAKLRKPDAQE